ncbi:MAG TPA: hypothetical protein VFO55_00785 [Gemmatimonadaceae bacterium]|nr:hypothetical protein [Gemmatimonadaceae bacterium]
MTMAKDGQVPGRQQHAEGQHGEKTHKAFIDGLHQREGGDEGTEGVAQEGSPFGVNPADGRHRLGEDREQHDEAEKNSELRKERGSDTAR